MRGLGYMPYRHIDDLDKITFPNSHNISYLFQGFVKPAAGFYSERRFSWVEIIAETVSKFYDSIIRTNNQ